MSLATVEEMVASSKIAEFNSEAKHNTTAVFNSDVVYFHGTITAKNVEAMRIQCMNERFNLYFLDVFDEACLEQVDMLMNAENAGSYYGAWRDWPHKET